MLKIMGKKIFTILRSKFLLSKPVVSTLRCLGLIVVFPGHTNSLFHQEHKYNVQVSNNTLLEKCFSRLLNIAPTCNLLTYSKIT